MPIPLLPDDDVLHCVQQINAHLRRAYPGNNSPSIGYFLANGKIEKQLKTFIGSAWSEANAESRAYTMDKRPFDGCEMDLLAFENTQPRFFIEAKCSFAQDRSNVWADARRALKQTDSLYTNLVANSCELANRFIECAAYIVHFLNTVPELADPRLPAWLLGRYPRSQPVLATELVAFYEDKVPGRYQSSQIVPIWNDPAVSAIIVKLNPGVMG